MNRKSFSTKKYFLERFDVESLSLFLLLAEIGGKGQTISKGR